MTIKRSYKEMKYILINYYQLSRPIVRIAISIMLLTSCSTKPKKETNYRSPAFTKDSTARKYTTNMVNNKKDPSCGMPLTAGIEDTLHFKGKVYGFCSAACKEEFKMHPDQYLTELSQ